MILNLGFFIGILVSMLKKEKRKVQEANAQLVKLDGSRSFVQSSSSSMQTEKILKHEASEDPIHAEQVKCKQNGERSNTLYKFSLHYITTFTFSSSKNPRNLIVFHLKPN